MTAVNATTPSAAEAVFANLARRAPVATETEDALGQGRFLTLLTTQLKNQDPMNPMDNAQVTSQLAQISTVDGIERLNTMLGQIMEGQQSAEALQAASLVGRGVLVPGTGLQLAAEGALGGFALEGPADQVTVSIRDASGLEVATLDLGAFDEGTHNFQWNGTATGGARAANGEYTVSITATAGDEPAAVEALEFGAVSSVVRGPHSTDLQVGDLGIFRMSEVRQIL